MDLDLEEMNSDLEEINKQTMEIIEMHKSVTIGHFNFMIGCIEDNCKEKYSKQKEYIDSCFKNDNINNKIVHNSHSYFYYYLIYTTLTKIIDHLFSLGAFKLSIFNFWKECDSNIFKHLLKYYAAEEINCKNNDGETLLHVMIKECKNNLFDYYEKIKILLENKHVNIEIEDNNGDLPIICLLKMYIFGICTPFNNRRDELRSKVHDICVMILKKMGNLYVETKDGKTLLHWICLSSNVGVKTLKFYVKLCGYVDFNVRDSEGNVGLYYVGVMDFGKFDYLAGNKKVNLTCQNRNGRYLINNPGFSDEQVKKLIKNGSTFVRDVVERQYLDDYLRTGIFVNVYDRD